MTILIQLIFVSFFICISSQEIAPVFTPENDSKVLEKQNENLQAAEIVIPVMTVNPPSQNLTNQSKSNSNKLRKRKYQNNKQYKPATAIEKKDSEQADQIKKNKNFNDLNNALLLQLAAQKLNTNQELNGLDRTNSYLSKYKSDVPIQFVPVYTSENNNNYINNDSNNLAIQTYLKKLAQLAQLAHLQKINLDKNMNEKNEKPKLTKRVFNSNPMQSNSNYNHLYQNQQLNNQPIYTLLQSPQQQNSQQSSPLYLALQPSFPVIQTSQPQSNQQSSLIETGDKIISKLKQWSTDILNPKTSLNRQINEVLGVVSDVALVTLVGVPVISLISFGLSSLANPLNHLNRKLDRKSSTNKQKTSKSEEKKDKDEKAAKSDASQKNLKMLDKKSRFSNIMEKAGEELNHFKNLVEIAKNLELAFKKYNVIDRECKYRILCELGSGNQTSETNSALEQILSTNMLRESRNRQARSITSNNQTFSTDNFNQTNQLNDKNVITEENNKCQQPNCSKPTTVKDQSLENQLKKNKRNFSFLNQRSYKNLLRNFNLDKIVAENREFINSLAPTFDHMIRSVQRSNFISNLFNDEQISQVFKSDKILKTISDQSKLVHHKVKDFLDNLNIFQNIVTKDSDSSKVKYKVIDSYRSKRSLNETNRLDVNSNEDKVHDISGLKNVLDDLLTQLFYEQNQDNLILPLSKIWLSPYLNAHEYGTKHTNNQCRIKFSKCTQNFLGFNNGNFSRKLELETVHNNHRKTTKKP